MSFGGGGDGGGIGFDDIRPYLDRSADRSNDLWRLFAGNIGPAYFQLLQTLLERAGINMDLPGMGAMRRPGEGNPGSGGQQPTGMMPAPGQQAAAPGQGMHPARLLLGGGVRAPDGHHQGVITPSMFAPRPGIGQGVPGVQQGGMGLAGMRNAFSSSLPGAGAGAAASAGSLAGGGMAGMRNALSQSMQQGAAGLPQQAAAKGGGGFAGSMAKAMPWIGLASMIAQNNQAAAAGQPRPGMQNMLRLAGMFQGTGQMPAASGAPPPPPSGMDRMRGIWGGAAGVDPEFSRYNQNRGGPGAGGMAGNQQGGPGRGGFLSREDQIRWQQGIDRLNKQFDVVRDQAGFGIGQRLGPGANSIQAGLRSSIAEGNGQALSDLHRQLFLDQSAQHDARLGQLMGALGAFFPAGMGSAGNYANLAGILGGLYQPQQRPGGLFGGGLIPGLL